MNQKELFDFLKSQFRNVLEANNLSSDEVVIKLKALTPEEAIGKPGRKDYPILTGKEIMLEADFRGAKGQAFTDAPAEFQGTMDKILALDLNEDQHARGLFIAALNAVTRHLGLSEKTIHCKNDEPEECAKKAVEFIKEKYGDVKIALVGYQPSLLENLSKEFNIRVLDLNPQNVGAERYGVVVEHGVDDFDEVVVNWSDLVLCTGSTLSNGTITNFLDLEKEVLFFGTTLAGAADMLGCKRMCFLAK